MASSQATAAAVSSASSSPPHVHKYSFAEQILGPDLFQQVRTSEILVVGAGGIGCEVLKDVVVAGFAHVEIIDLDTIDLSNLNRQFLFNKSHIKKSKSIVAASVAQSFNPDATIIPHHGNIKEGRFGIDFFRRFDVVLNALDNLDARRWVNRMCVAGKVPLVESGTTGFLGQVQPIVSGVTSCYDCTEKPVQKTYPVCTIRSTPSTPIHCVVWAKTWLFNQLFGQDDETETVELDKAEADGGNADEIGALRKEASEMRNLRESLLEPGAAEQVFDKIFKADIERLLSMEEMWRSRTKPTPFSYVEASNAPALSSAVKTLRDQTELGIRETAEMFASSLDALAKRAKVSKDALSFDKDDDDALDFVTAASNLRSRVYNIGTKTRFDVKQMAGNIIPAIASTNAIISGALVLQAMHLMQQKWADARDVMLGKSTKFVLSGTETAKPNLQCGVCADIYVPTKVNDLSQVTLGDVIEAAQQPTSEGGLALHEIEELGVYEGSRLLADPDFDDNANKTLESLAVDDGKFLALVDEDGGWTTVQLIIQASTLEGGRRIVFAPVGSDPVLKRRPATAADAGSDDSDGASDIVAEAEEDDGFLINDDPSASALFAARKDIAGSADGDTRRASKRQRRSLDEDKAVPTSADGAEITKKRRTGATDPDDVADT